MIRSLVLTPLFFVVFLSVASAQSLTTITLAPIRHGLLKIYASVNGHEGTFLFDSGSGLSNITPEFANAIKCHPWGQITGFRMTGQRLDMRRCDDVSFTLAGRRFPARTVGVFDLSSLLPSDVGHIDGTIALDIFENEAFTLSYGDHSIKLLDTEALKRSTRDLRSIPVRVVRDVEGLALTVNLPVITPSGKAWFEMDTGNTSSFIVVGKALTSQFVWRPAENNTSTIEVNLEGGTAFSGKAEALDLILDGNLGTSFLVSHDVTVDPARQLAWIRPYNQLKR
jgi:hypothetical protein